MHNSNVEIDKNFFKCWRNIYILKTIFHHLNIYKKVYFSLVKREKPFHFDIESLSRFKYRCYLNEIIIGPSHFHQSINKQLFYHKKSCYKYNDNNDEDSDNENCYYYFAIKDDDDDNIHYKSESDYNNTINKNQLKSSGTHQFVKNKKRKIENDNDDGIKEVEVETSKRFICNCFSFLKNDNSNKNRENYLLKKGMIPNCCEILYLEVSNKIIEPGLIPNSVKELVINGWINSLNFNKITNNNNNINNLEKGSIPDSVEYLQFESNFNKKFKENLLPNTIKYLEFSWDYNKKISDGVLPKSLESLKFGYNYNKPFSNNVFNGINNLTYLSFGHCFDQNIEEINSTKLIIPNSIKYLIFGNDFNCKLNSLPLNIRELEFGWEFNQPINFQLPPNIKTIVFGGCFKQNLSSFIFKNSLSLESIEFGRNYNPPINEIPNFIKVNKKILK